MDIYIRILMVDIAEFVADLHCYTELLAAFANECLLMRLARFELSADELPQRALPLFAGRRHIMNLSPCQMRAAAT